MLIIYPQKVSAYVNTATFWLQGESLVVSVSYYTCISQDGVSALMFAASEGHTEVVTQLLKAGANTDLQSTEVKLS